MKHYRCQQADLEMHARVWDRVCDILFNGHKPEPFEPIDDVPDDETYCALYCAEERRAWEDCALVGGCPLERKGGEPHSRFKEIARKFILAGLIAVAPVTLAHAGDGGWILIRLGPKNTDGMHDAVIREQMFDTQASCLKAAGQLDIYIQAYKTGGVGVCAYFPDQR